MVVWQESQCECAPAGYSCAVDYWSLGILVFYLLDGSVPFQASTDMRTSALQFPPHCSAAAIDLLQSLLCSDVTRRLGEKDGDCLRIKSHKFFQVLQKPCTCAHDSRCCIVQASKLK